MKKNHLTLTQPLEAIIFDCDGTLSQIEGIDELARQNNVGEQVAQLTAAAMGSVGMSPELYAQRLNLVLPTRQQINELALIYFKHLTSDVMQVLKTFQSLNKSIYIISAGLYPAVAGFGKLLHIPTENIFAVDIYFDKAGKYLNFDQNSPLVYSNGKRVVVKKIIEKHSQTALVGDGLSDYEAYDLVTRFIGYGGAFYRENIKQLCEYYISEPSLLPLLELCLTSEEIKKDPFKIIT